MERGDREDGVEKRERELRAAKAASELAAERRETGRAAAFARLHEALLSHLSQETQLPVGLNVAQDGEWRFLQATIHFENAEGVWHRTIFTCGVQRHLVSDLDTLPITYCVHPVWDSSQPEPVGAKRITAITHGTLGEVVATSVKVAIEAMARERLAGGRIISGEEAGERIDGRENQRAASAVAEKKRRQAQSLRGCLIGGAVFVGIVFLVGQCSRFVHGY